MRKQLKANMIWIFCVKSVATNTISSMLAYKQVYDYYVLTMYLDRSETTAHGKTYRRVLLRQSFRQNGKVKHRTIANLSACVGGGVKVVEKWRFENPGALARISQMLMRWSDPSSGSWRLR